MSGKAKSWTGQQFTTFEYYGSRPWQTEPDGERCNILAFSKLSGRWEIVVIVYPFGKASAYLMAKFIVRIVNERLEHGHLLLDSYTAFKGIFEEGLNFTTEQDAEIVYKKLQQVQF